MRLRDALEASVARVKELEAQVKDFKCEQVFRISEMQELVEAQQRISELEDMLAARQPGEDDYEAMRIAVGRVVRDVMNFPQAVQARLLGQDMSPLRDALVDSVVEAGFSRAAVPDAAPSEDDREVVANDLREIGATCMVGDPCGCADCENASEWVNAPLAVVLDHVVPRAVVPDAATELRAERDAALAAVERVRVIHRETGASGDCVVCIEWGWPCPTVAALDGAPEPEWEYGAALVSDPDEADAHPDKQTAHKHITGWNESVARIKRMGRHTSGPSMLVRRRKAGPWRSSPVEWCNRFVILQGCGV